MAETLRKITPSPRASEAQATSRLTEVPGGVTPMPTQVLRPESVRQAYQILHTGFTIAPIAAGADKFFNRLVDWEKYLYPEAPRKLGVSPRQFMLGAGVIEILAGVGVARKPQLYGYVVSAWLLGIVGNLLRQRKYYDIALRDFGLALGALALARLSQEERAQLWVRAA